MANGKDERPAIDIAAIAAELDLRAPAHHIGQLQSLRKELKGLDRLASRKIFGPQTTREDWACHLGGRTELQFNIGCEDDELRHGVAFSFERSRTLPSIELLVPLVKFFNDYMLANAEAFGDMRMWHYREEERSQDHMPGPIPAALVSDGVFVFLGSREPANNIDHEKILDDFDRLLPLYMYVESQGKAPALPIPPDVGFAFKPGCSIKPASTTATRIEQELDLDLRHNALQWALYARLAAKYGEDKVGTERPNGAGTRVDIVVSHENEVWFYEIKTSLTARACLREALGQLLEYGFWPGAQEAVRLIVAGESALDNEGTEYLRRLQKRFSLPIEYEQIVCQP